MTPPRCLLRLVVLLGTLAQPLPADIYRWDTGTVIPGTKGIKPGPGVQLTFWNSESRNLRGQNLTGAHLDNSTLTGADLTGTHLY